MKSPKITFICILYTWICRRNFVISPYIRPQGKPQTDLVLNSFQPSPGYSGCFHEQNPNSYPSFDF